MRVYVKHEPDGPLYHVETDTVEGERELADHVTQAFEDDAVESITLTRHEG